MAYLDTKRWRENNPDQFREMRKRAYWGDIEGSRRRLVEYRWKNKDKINQRRRENYALNSDEIRLQVSEYRNRNRDVINRKRRSLYAKKRMRGVFRFMKIKKGYTKSEVVNVTEVVIQNAVEDFIKNGGVIEKIDIINPIMGVNRVNTKISNAVVPAGFYELEI